MKYIVTINEKHNGFGFLDNLLAMHSNAPPPKCLYYFNLSKVMLFLDFLNIN